MITSGMWFGDEASGRMRTRSVRAPNRKATTIAPAIARRSGAPHWWNCQAQNAEIIAISPCAKFTIPEAR